MPSYLLSQIIDSAGHTGDIPVFRGTTLSIFRNDNRKGRFLMSNGPNALPSWEDVVASAGAPIYPLTQIPFGDGATIGGITSSDLTWTAGTGTLIASLVGNRHLITSLPFFGMGDIDGASNSTYISGSNTTEQIYLYNPDMSFVLNGLARTITFGDIGGLGNQSIFVLDDANQTLSWIEGSLAGASNGDVWTLVNSGTGEGAWQPPSGGVTPAALSKVDDTNVTLTLGGTPLTALLQATSLTLGWTGQLSIARGGTNSGAALANNLVMVSTAGAIVESSVTTTELGYLSGAVSNIQNQINALQAGYKLYLFNNCV